VIVLFKQVPGGFELVGSFGNDLASAFAAVDAFDGWQIEEQTELGVCIVANKVAAH